MQPSLVALRDELVADVGSERDQKSIEFYTTCFPTRCLAISHVAQGSKTIPRTDLPLIGQGTLNHRRGFSFFLLVELDAVAL